MTTERKKETAVVVLGTCVSFRRASENEYMALAEHGRDAMES